MKVFFLLLNVIMQTLAISFYEDIRGAVTDVERGFEKLISDVVTDVTDTIHCTLSAFEEVLVLKGVLDNTSAYKYRCKGVPKHTSSPLEITDKLLKSPLDKFKKPYFPSSREFTTRKISMDIKSSIANTTKTINDILSKPVYLDHQSNVLQKETHRLNEISDLLKKEVEKLSSNVKSKLKNKYYNSRDSVESIWHEIKTLHDIKENSNSPTDISEISSVFDKIVNKLDMPSSSAHKNIENFNLDDIGKQLRKFSPSTSPSREFNERLSEEIREHDLSSKNLSLNIMPKTFKENQIINYNSAIRQKSNNNSKNSQKPKFNLDFVSDYFTSFASHESDHKETIDTARNIIQESQLTDKSLKEFFQTQKLGSDVFSSSNLFSFR